MSVALPRPRPRVARTFYFPVLVRIKEDRRCEGLFFSGALPVREERSGNEVAEVSFCLAKLIQAVHDLQLLHTGSTRGQRNQLKCAAGASKPCSDGEILCRITSKGLHKGNRSRGGGVKIHRRASARSGPKLDGGWAPKVRNLTAMCKKGQIPNRLDPNYFLGVNDFLGVKNHARPRVIF